MPRTAADNNALTVNVATSMPAPFTRMDEDESVTVLPVTYPISTHRHLAAGVFVCCKSISVILPLTSVGTRQFELLPGHISIHFDRLRWHAPAICIRAATRLIKATGCKIS